MNKSNRLRFDTTPKAKLLWEALWEQTHGATIFQHPSFYGILEQHTKCKLQLIWNEDSSACLPVCLTPLKLGVWRRDLAYKGKYGGALGSVDECQEWWQKCLDYIDVGVLNPWQAHPESSSAYEYSQDETSIFPLFRDKQKTKYKRILTKAKKQGLTVIPVSFSKVALAFEYLYKGQCKRWGIPYSGASLRLAQFSLPGSATYVVYDKNAVPIHIEAYMKCGRTLVNCYVAQNEIGRATGAGVALLHAHASMHRDQLDFIDLGPSGGFAQVKHYKTTIGGENTVLKAIQEERFLVRSRFALGKAKVDLLRRLGKPFGVGKS